MGNKKNAGGVIRFGLWLHLIYFLEKSIAKSNLIFPNIFYFLFKKYMIKFLKKKIIKKKIDWDSEYIKVTEMVVYGICLFYIFLRGGFYGDSYFFQQYFYAMWLHSITYFSFYYKQPFWKRNLYNFMLNPNIILFIINRV
jgi:hypothetical protein